MTLLRMVGFHPDELPLVHWNTGVVPIPTPLGGHLEVGPASHSYGYAPGRYPGLYAVTLKSANGTGTAFTQTGRVGLQVSQTSPPVGSTDTLVVGFARKEVSGQTIPTSIAGFYSSNGTMIGEVTLSDTTRKIGLIAGGRTVTSDLTLPSNTWEYIEIKYFPHNTAGIFEIKVNGVVFATMTGDTYSPSGTVLPVGFVYLATKVRGGNVAVPERAEPVISVGDVYLLDTSGTKNNDYLGEIIVTRLRPNASGDASDFLGSDGNSVNNYQLVAHNVPQSGQHVSASVVGSKDLYGLDEPPSFVEAVLATQTRVWVTRDEPGPAKVSIVEKTSGVERVETPASIGVGDTLVVGPIRENAPNEQPLTKEELADRQIGVRISE